MKPLVLYHASCNDGITCAWLFWKYVSRDVDFIPVQYGDSPPDVTRRKVYILDFSFKRPVLEDMLWKAAHLTLLDHHTTAEQDLKGLFEWGVDTVGRESKIIFDVEKSGARLTWENLCVSHSYDPDTRAQVFANPPWIVEYTEDRDMWRWKLPYSREVSAALASYPRTIEEWEDIAGGPGIQALIPEGRAILRYQSQIIEAAFANAHEVQIAGHKVPMVNATCLVSEIGQALAKGKSFAAVYFFTQDRVVFSLRSAPDGLDVSEVALQFGGGGHKHAAGFSLPGFEIGREIMNPIKQDLR